MNRLSTIAMWTVVVAAGLNMVGFLPGWIAIRTILFATVVVTGLALPLPSHGPARVTRRPMRRLLPIRQVWKEEEGMDQDLSKYLEDVMKGETDPYDEDAIISGCYPVYKVRQRARAFLGAGPYSYAPLDVPRYYADLLAWAYDRHLITAGWSIAAVMDPQGIVPTYRNVNVAPGRWEEKLFVGIALLRRGEQRLVATLNESREGGTSLLVTSPASNVADMGVEFVSGVQRIMREENLYKGGKIQLESRIRFLDLAQKGWDDLVLPAGVKEDVMAHSVDFLARSDRLAAFGIAPRRGILLTGRPGTGKTLLCKVLMNNSPDITCITIPAVMLTFTYGLQEVYELARDLSPCIVFLEDVDLVGQGRFESFYSRGEALAQLLYALDGIEECRNVVTIATTNWLDILDEALKDRPSRFDRIVSVDLPDIGQRKEFLDHLSRRIPMPRSVMEHLAARSEGMTPAQIQEVVHAVVIESGVDPTDSPNWHSVFSAEAVDQALARVCRKPQRMGFDTRSGKEAEGPFPPS